MSILRHFLPKKPKFLDHSAQIMLNLHKINSNQASSSYLSSLDCKSTSQLHLLQGIHSESLEKTLKKKSNPFFDTTTTSFPFKDYESTAVPGKEKPLLGMDSGLSSKRIPVHLGNQPFYICLTLRQFQASLPQSTLFSAWDSALFLLTQRNLRNGIWQLEDKQQRPRFDYFWYLQLKDNFLFLFF